MAFVSKFGGLLRQSQQKPATATLYQAIRCMSSKLFIGGLSYGVDDTSLREAFCRFGEVTEARVILDRDTGRSRGFGFVTFTSSEEASSAISGMDGKDLHGRIVRVNYATDRGGGFRSGGGYGGYGSTGGYSGGGYGSGGGSYGGGYGGNYGNETGNYGGGNFGGGEGNYNAGSPVGSEDRYSSGGGYGGGGNFIPRGPVAGDGYSGGSSYSGGAGGNDSYGSPIGGASTHGSYAGAGMGGNSGSFGGPGATDYASGSHEDAGGGAINAATQTGNENFSQSNAYESFTRNSRVGYSSSYAKGESEVLGDHQVEFQQNMSMEMEKDFANNDDESDDYAKRA